MNKAVWFLSFIILLLVIPKLLICQKNNDLVYFDDGNVEEGIISMKTIEKKNSKFFFKSQTREDTILLSPKSVKSFAMINAKPKAVKLFERKVNQNGSFTFYEKIYKNKEYSIFKSIEDNIHFIETEEKEFIRIPAGKIQRRNLFQRLLPFKPKIISNKSFSNKISNLKKLVNHLSAPSFRFPSQYIGLKISYSSFKSSNITKNRALQALFPRSYQSEFDRYSIDVYMNSIQDKAGRIATDISLGGHVIESKGNIDNESSLLAYSLKGYYGHTSLMLNYYLKKGKVFPYLTSGAQLSLLLRKDDLIITTTDIDAKGVQLDYFPSQFFHTFNWTPKIGLGLEIPLKENNFLSVESTLESIKDAEEKRVLIVNFTIGLNLI